MPSANNSSIIIADLHIGNEISAFNKFCTEIAPQYDNLFILGDLFDLYLGDSFIDSYYLPVINILKTLSKKNNIYIMRGNRDFLLAKKFAQQSGATIIEEPYILNKFVLIHGDHLVIDDKQYQLFKMFIQNSVTKFILNALANSFLLKLATFISKKSSQLKKNKTADIMDVNNEFCDKFMQNFKGYDLIHGHTHRPNIHIRKDYKRYVLASWDSAPTAIIINDSINVINLDL